MIRIEDYANNIFNDLKKSDFTESERLTYLEDLLKKLLFLYCVSKIRELDLDEQNEKQNDIKNDIINKFSSYIENIYIFPSDLKWEDIKSI